MAVKSNLARAVVTIEALIKAKNEAAAIIVEGAAKRRCPVDSGRLRASITHDSDGEGFIVGTNTEYAPYVELGTRYQSPQPYLVPGLQESIGELQGIYGS